MSRSSKKKPFVQEKLLSRIEKDLKEQFLESIIQMLRKIYQKKILKNYMETF